MDDLVRAPRRASHIDGQPRSLAAQRVPCASQPAFSRALFRQHVACGIGQARQPSRRGARDVAQHPGPPRWCEPCLRRRAGQFRAPRISQNQPRAIGQKVRREIRIDCPEKPVTIWQVALPFAVSAEIGPTAFAFHDPDFPVGRDRDDIDPQTAAWHELKQRCMTQTGKETRHPALQPLAGQRRHHRIGLQGAGGMCHATTMNETKTSRKPPHGPSTASQLAGAGYTRRLIAAAAAPICEGGGFLLFSCAAIFPTGL